MIRFIFYIILTYIIFFAIKFILNLFRKKTPLRTPPPNAQVNKDKETLDKSKIVDADFEEIK
jgi:hypothetical protein